MKTTSLGAKMARLHTSIAEAITGMAAARGLDLAVAQAAFEQMNAPRPHRLRATKRKGTSGYHAHAVNPAGSKLARKVGRLTHRHSV